MLGGASNNGNDALRSSAHPTIFSMNYENLRVIDCCYLFFIPLADKRQGILLIFIESMIKPSTNTQQT